MVERGRPPTTIRHMRIACWTTKARGKHSEYVILIVFPQQQWLGVSASVLRYMHVVRVCVCCILLLQSVHCVCVCVCAASCYFSRYIHLLNFNTHITSPLRAQFVDCVDRKHKTCQSSEGHCQFCSVLQRAAANLTNCSL
jgi:hypothetical protein